MDILRGLIASKFSEFLQSVRVAKPKIRFDCWFKNLDNVLIKNGLGWWYYYFSHDQNLKKYQESAMENHLGLWHDQNNIAPWEWRKLNR